jgi:hypothetical protein
LQKSDAKNFQKDDKGSKAVIRGRLIYQEHLFIGGSPESRKFFKKLDQNFSREKSQIFHI